MTPQVQQTIAVEGTRLAQLLDGLGYWLLLAPIGVGVLASWSLTFAIKRLFKLGKKFQILLAIGIGFGFTLVSWDILFATSKTGVMVAVVVGITCPLLWDVFMWLLKLVAVRAYAKVKGKELEFSASIEDTFEGEDVIIARDGRRKHNG